MDLSDRPGALVELSGVTKTYGSGRVFYNSLGHHTDIVEAVPCLTIMRRGFAWAAR
jgi:type 1 glutamine amidotransferase